MLQKRTDEIVLLDLEEKILCRLFEMTLTHLAFVAMYSFSTSMEACTVDMVTGFSIATVTTRKRALQTVGQSVTFYKNRIHYDIYIYSIPFKT